MNPLDVHPWITRYALPVASLNYKSRSYFYHLGKVRIIFRTDQKKLIIKIPNQPNEIYRQLEGPFQERILQLVDSPEYSG